MSAEACVGCGRDADVLTDDAQALCAVCAQALLPPTPCECGTPAEATFCRACEAEIKATLAEVVW